MPLVEPYTLTLTGVWANIELTGGRGLITAPSRSQVPRVVAASGTWVTGGQKCQFLPKRAFFCIKWLYLESYSN